MTQAHLLLIALFAVILYCTTKKDKDVKDIRGLEEDLGWSSWSFCRGCETGCELCTTQTNKHTACIGGELKGTCSEPAEPAHINKQLPVMKFSEMKPQRNSQHSCISSKSRTCLIRLICRRLHISPYRRKRCHHHGNAVFVLTLRGTSCHHLQNLLDKYRYWTQTLRKDLPRHYLRNHQRGSQLVQCVLTINMEKHLCHLKAQILCASAAPRTRWALVEELMKSVGAFLDPVSPLEEAVEVIRHRALPMFL